MASCECIDKLDWLTDDEGTMFLDGDKVCCAVAVTDGALDIVSLVVWQTTDRRQGYGTATVRRVIAKAKQMGIANVSVTATRRSKAFYEKLGFTGCGTNLTVDV